MTKIARPCPGNEKLRCVWHGQGLALLFYASQWQRIELLFKARALHCSAINGVVIAPSGVILQSAAGVMPGADSQSQTTQRNSKTNSSKVKWRWHSFVSQRAMATNRVAPFSDGLAWHYLVRLGPARQRQCVFKFSIAWSASARKSDDL